MLNGKGNENGKTEKNKNKAKGLISKKETSLQVQHTFLYIFFAVFHVKLPEIS